jgi:DNA polymerase I-like protein with 3'-5' exonuclease and polymerase domains
MLTIDFETEGIDRNPVYKPPKPVGVAIKHGNEPSRYYAWGHPTGNNCTFEEGRAALLTALEAADQYTGWLAHNAPFECAVLRDWFGYVPKDPLKVHDTQYLLFLTDPYAYTFSLKPSAERILGLPPDERDAVRDWLLSHQPMKHKGITIAECREESPTRHAWGRYICLAPGDLVGKYAEGDTDRTYELFQHLMPRVCADGMRDAYMREQRLMPILGASTQKGVRCDTEKLEADILKYRAAQRRSDEYIFSRLGEFDLQKDAELAAALDRHGMVTEWVLTPTGRRSVARKNLVGRVRDPDILNHLTYRGILETCLGTFAEPWLAQANQEQGRLHPQWNQVRGDRGADGDMSGTRTGRMSCRAPNLQNPPNDFEDVVVPEGQPDIMHMRTYLLPEEWHVWLKRDFSAQEMRILAHYTEGKLAEAFRKDPSTDPHAAVQRLIKEYANVELSRKHVKITGFGIMYGRGIPNLSAALGVDIDVGKATRDAYFQALPEVRTLSQGTRDRGRVGGFITTWGGRRYVREPNDERDLSYKLLNYLIQGSAADQTKQSMVDWNAIRKPTDILLAAVHDEINICAPQDEVEAAMHRLQTAMDWPRFDVPFQSEGYRGPNWSQLEKDKS